MCLSRPVPQSMSRSAPPPTTRSAAPPPPRPAPLCTRLCATTTLASDLFGLARRLLRLKKRKLMRRPERQDSYRELLATLVGAEPVSKVESTLVQTVESMLEPIVELMLD